MRKNNILAYIQPVFVDMDMDIVEARIGKRRMEKVYAWKSMIDMGIHASGGSDAPVVPFDVMENIYFAVTRKKLSGEPESSWLPSEKLSTWEAVRLFTKYPAYASYTEYTNGTLEEGKYADLVVLEKNIFHVDHDEIKNIKIHMTMANGRIVYEK
jgi:predicted amidohydrolase YtcJ